jgi:hypothetical protein
MTQSFIPQATDPRPFRTQPLSRPTGSSRAHTPQRSSLKWVWASGCLATAVGMMFSDPQALLPQIQAAKSNCQQVVQKKAEVSRSQLTEFLAVPEKANRTKVRQVIAEPYCLLPPAQIRAHTPAKREAYPLAFDRNTWLVVMYEGDEYVGYDFSIR